MITWSSFLVSIYVMLTQMNFQRMNGSLSPLISVTSPIISCLRDLLHFIIFFCSSFCFRSTLADVLRTSCRTIIVNYPPPHDPTPNNTSSIQLLFYPSCIRIHFSPSTPPGYILHTSHITIFSP